MGIVDYKAAYEVTAALLEQCKAENQRLIEAGKFYADPATWSAGEVQKLALTDRGELMRQALKGAGYV